MNQFDSDDYTPSWRNRAYAITEAVMEPLVVDPVTGTATLPARYGWGPPITVRDREQLYEYLALACHDCWASEAAYAVGEPDDLPTVHDIVETALAEHAAKLLPLRTTSEESGAQTLSGSTPPHQIDGGGDRE